VWLLYGVDSKIFSVLTGTTGGTHPAPLWTRGGDTGVPRTTGGDTLPCPGQQALSLRANQDSAESIKSSLPHHCWKKYFKKVDTTNH